ncbi:RNA polymerase sigma factor sigV [uncultured Eubacterium sp.]|nr:RNA polymerase sigma factor sigV [uncultured Eubacterium sp.]
MKDAELITRIKQGERDLLGILIERYYDQIFKFCYYKTGDETLACDCAQDTFLRMIRYMDTYIEKDRFKSYLFQIASNVCNDGLRKRGDCFIEDQAEAKEKMTAASDRGDIGEQMAMADAVKSALAALPQIQRDVIILRFYSDLKVSEIAKITGASIPTVKSRLRQGKNKLKTILEKEGLF